MFSASDYLFNDISMAKSLGRQIQCLPKGQKVGMLTVHYEVQVPIIRDQGFSRIMYLTVGRHPSGLSCIAPVGLRDKEN